MTSQSYAYISISFQQITFKLGNFPFFKGFFSAEFSLTCPMQSKVLKKNCLLWYKGHDLEQAITGSWVVNDLIK